MDASKQYKLIIKNKSSDNDTSTSQPNIIPISDKMIKSEGCSTFLQCEIEQIIKGLLTIEIQLDNEEYECVIQEKSCQSSCPAKPLPSSLEEEGKSSSSKPPPVLTIPPPPPLTEGEIGLPLPPSPPPTLPPKPYHNNNLLWRQSLPIFETMHQPRCNRVAYTPSPSLGRRMPKPMLRSKMELMAEVENAYYDAQANTTIHQEQPIYDDTCEYIEIENDDEDVNDGLVGKMSATNIYGIPREESDRISYRTRSSESIIGMQSRANASFAEKKKKKFSCV